MARQLVAILGIVAAAMGGCRPLQQTDDDDDGDVTESRADGGFDINRDGGFPIDRDAGPSAVSIARIADVLRSVEAP